MQRFLINLENQPEELRTGLREIMSERGDRLIGNYEAGVKTIIFTLSRESEIRSTVSESTITIRYHRRNQAFRALGRLLGTDADEMFTEYARFRDIAAMMDASRNGVPTVQTVHGFLRKMALMGFNVLMLYMEDTYKIPGRPYFGYMRGGYCHEELLAIDDYADSLGIEVIPCIQTLGHFEQILQWPAFFEYRDNDHVILADRKDSAELLAQMIKAASSPFRTKRIHVGMDEAGGVGQGRYRYLYGDKPLSEILLTHLETVMELCRQEGLAPIMWGDMFFRLGSREHMYYDLESNVPDSIKDRIPDDMTMVYWDYDHQESNFFQAMIRKHAAFKKIPMVAVGGWTWKRFWANCPYAFGNILAGLTAAKQTNVEGVMLTLWMDDGAECELASAYAPMQFFAEQAYAQEATLPDVARQFFGATGGPLEDWLIAAKVDQPPTVEEPGRNLGNPSKWLLWQDPMLNFMDACVSESELEEHYRKLADQLGKKVENGKIKALVLPARVARVLFDRMVIRRLLKGEFTDKTRLQAVREAVEQVMEDYKKIWEVHREIWMATYKPFGWEVLEKRYGGILARFATLKVRLDDVISGKIADLPELMEPVLAHPVPPAPEGSLPLVDYERLISPSRVR